MSAPPETAEQQLARVELMAGGSETWDLSANDQAALKTVLQQRDAALEALRPFARLGRHLEKHYGPGGRHAGAPDLVLHGWHLVVGERVELRLSDCLTALEKWRAARSEEP